MDKLCLSKPLFVILPLSLFATVISCLQLLQLTCNLVSPASLNVPSCYISFWDCIVLWPFLSLRNCSDSSFFVAESGVQLWKNTVKMEPTDMKENKKYRELNSFERHRSQVLRPFGLLTRIIHEYVTQSLLNYDKGCVCLWFCNRG